MQAKEVNWFKKQLCERPVPVWVTEFRTGSLSVPERQEVTESSEAARIQEHQASRGMPHTPQCVKTMKRQRTTVPGPFFPPRYLDQITQLFLGCQKQRWKQCFHTQTPSQHSETGIKYKNKSHCQACWAPVISNYTVDAGVKTHRAH